MAEEAAEEEDAGTCRRDPSEKQEPHTVMWGINVIYITLYYIDGVPKHGKEHLCEIASASLWGNL